MNKPSPGNELSRFHAGFICLVRNVIKNRSQNNSGTESSALISAILNKVGLLLHAIGGESTLRGKILQFNAEVVDARTEMRLADIRMT